MEYKQPNNYHYEFSIEKPYKKTKSQESFKDAICLVTKNFDGWCSEEKAHVLIDLIFLKKPSIVVEIGVFGGRSLFPMAAALKKNGSGIIYAIDPWDVDYSISHQEGEHLSWWGKIDHETIYKNFINNIKKLHLEKQIVVLRQPSIQAQISEKIDMIHIDGNHSEMTSLEDVKRWVPQVKSGGVVVFDDVNLNTTNKAVEWLDKNCIRFQEFEGDNIWAIWIKP